MFPPDRSRWWRLGLPPAALLAVVAIQRLWLPWAWSEAPALLYLPVVILSAWSGGPGSGLLACGMAMGLILGQLPEPAALLGPGGWDLRLRVGQFALEGLLICLAVAALDRSHRRAQQAAAEQAAGDRRYRRLVETASEGIWIFDPRGLTEYVNPRLAAMLGYPPDRMVGRPVTDFLDERSREESARVLRRRREESRERLEFRYRRRDGSPLHALVSLSPIYDDDGTYGGTLAMLTDVTRRRQAEDARAASEAQLRFALEAARIGSWRWDLTSGVVRWSENLEPLHGLAPGTFGGTFEAFRALVHPADRNALTETIVRAIGDLGDFEREFRVIWPDGTIRWMYSRGRAFAGDDGRPARLVGIGMDVTGRKRAEEGLAFLAEAGAALAASLEFEQNLAAVARLAVPRVADWCLVDMVEPDGRLRRLAAAHVDPGGDELIRRYLPTGLESCGPGHVARLGVPQVVAQVTPAMIEAAACDPDHLQALRRLRPGSYLGVPLRAHGRTLGVISLLTSESGRRFSDDDLHLAEALAARAAVAVENARLFRRAEAALRTEAEAVALLDTLFSTAPVGFAFLDPARRFVRINPQMARFNGRSPEEHLGRTPDEISPALEATIGPLLDRVLATGLPVLDVELGGETRDLPGVRRDWLASYYPVRVGTGPILGVGIVVVEITERTRVERELREAKRAADDANLAKDRFLAVLSHELRTPLTPVLATVTAMLDDPETPGALRPTLELTRRNVELEARLIDDLLDVTRIVRGKLPLNTERVDAHVLIGRALEMCPRPPAAPACTLALEAAEPHVLADPARLQQVFWNILKNALKFTPAGGHVAVRTRTRPAGETGETMLVVEVRDDGVGIAAEALPRIFDAFEQGDASITRRFGGLGLGLAISRSVVEAHGGRIAAASDGPGRGACFTVELLASPAGSTAGDAPAAAPAPASGLPDGPARPLRILLVEDDPDTLAVVARLLRRRGHAVSTGESVAAGIAAFDAAGEPFDLVVSDLGLPDGTGYDLLRLIRAREPDLPALALSGYGTEADIRRSEASGFAGHLTKPVDFPRFEALARAVCAAR